MSYCEAHSYRHEIVSGCPRCLDNKRCLQIGGLVMETELKDAEIAALKGKVDHIKTILAEAAWLYDDATDAMRCTWCGTGSDAHKPTCKVAKALEATK